MLRKDRNKPSVHKHSKKPAAKPSMCEPAIAERISRKLNMTEDIIAKLLDMAGTGSVLKITGILLNTQNVL